MQEVGKALKTVLNLGNGLLLPIRLMNETARAFEKRKFEEIANRFQYIPEDQIIDVSPEIGVPIMDRLSYTGDESLRSLFIELLAKAATASLVESAHPSFVQIISLISPDEAILIRHLCNGNSTPLISLEARNQMTGATTTLHDFIIEPPSDIIFPERLPLYLSNLVGLGLIEIRRSTWITEDGAYDSVENYAKEKCNPPSSVNIGGEDIPVSTDKHVIIGLPYGMAFTKACTS